MAETRKRTRKAAENAGSLVTVDANKLREALKHTFEGVTMLFDCIGLNVPVGEPLPEQEAKPAQSGPAEEPEFTPVEEPSEEPPIMEAPADGIPASEPTVVAAQEEKNDDPPAEAPPAVSTVTQDDITKIIVRKIKQDRSNNEKIGAILKTYGVSKVSDLPATKYEAFLTDISQI